MTDEKKVGMDTGDARQKSMVLAFPVGLALDLVFTANITYPAKRQPPRADVVVKRILKEALQYDGVDMALLQNLICAFLQEKQVEGRVLGFGCLPNGVMGHFYPGQDVDGQATHVHDNLKMLLQRYQYLLGGSLPYGYRRLDIHMGSISFSVHTKGPSTLLDGLTVEDIARLLVMLFSASPQHDTDTLYGCVESFVSNRVQPDTKVVITTQHYGQTPGQLAGVGDRVLASAFQLPPPEVPAPLTGTVSQSFQQWAYSRYPDLQGEMQAFVGMCRYHAAEKGYKPGWVWNCYKARYPGLLLEPEDFDGPSMERPSTGFYAWVKQHHAPYAKALGRQIAREKRRAQATGVGY